MHRLPTGAMRGHEQVGLEVIEGFDRRLDDRLELRAAEMEPADDGSDRSLPGEQLRVPDYVDDPGVTASGQHHEAATRQAHHNRLVIEDQRVGLPAAVNIGFVSLEARLERRRAIDLARHDYRAVEQERRLSFLDDLESRALQRRAAGRGQLGRIEAGDRYAPTPPEVRVYQHR